MPPSPASVQLSCADAYIDFIARVPQTEYFQTALEHLLPAISLSICPSDLSEMDFWAIRCFCAYIVYKLYTPYPVALNPFRSVLEAFILSPEDSSRGPIRLFNDVLRLILSDRGAELDTFRPRVALERILGSADTPPTPLPLAPQPQPLREHDPASGLSPDSKPRLDRATIPEAPSSLCTTESGNDSERRLCGHLLSEARTRVLSLSEQRRLLRALPDVFLDDLRAVLSPDAVPALANLNGRIASTVMARVLCIEASGAKSAHLENDSLILRDPEMGLYVDALSLLPPIFSSFDVIGNLLKLEKEHFGQQLPIVRSIVVERFISNCLRIIEGYEREEQGAEVDDEGRTTRAVRMVAKFALAVLKSDAAEPGPVESSTPNVQPPTTVASPSSQQKTFGDGLDVELTNFALQHSRLVEANTLYRTLASRFIYQ